MHIGTLVSRVLTLCHVVSLEDSTRVGTPELPITGMTVQGRSLQRENTKKSEKQTKASHLEIIHKSLVRDHSETGHWDMPTLYIVFAISTN